MEKFTVEYHEFGRSYNTTTICANYDGMIALVKEKTKQPHIEIISIFRTGNKRGFIDHERLIGNVRGGNQ